VKANPSAAVALLAPIWGDLPPAVVATVNERRSYAVKAVDRAALSEQPQIGASSATAADGLAFTHCPASTRAEKTVATTSGCSAAKRSLTV
jgi:hypothetical protein